MSNTFGSIFKISIFGESHSTGIGIVMDGIPPGTPIDMELVRQAMARRAPNHSAASTKRKEPDVPEILSGYINGKTTGTPLAVLIRNQDTRSQDYEKMKTLMRPGHADYTGYMKYNGANDVRGGGHFSGRLTAPLVFAGAVARQFLALKGIYTGAHIASISTIEDDGFDAYTRDYFDLLERKAFAVNNDKTGEDMNARIKEAAAQKDSLGGVIHCAVCGMPAGLGEPFFDSVESELAHLLFSIPAVKGVEFGTGFAITRMRGSLANDSMGMEGGKPVFLSNHNGGINGGITNAMPVEFRVAIKPTPSIALPQQTIDIENMRAAKLEITGRHDACIVPRAVEVVKSAAMIVMMDLYLRQERKTDG